MVEEKRSNKGRRDSDKCNDCKNGEVPVMKKEIRIYTGMVLLMFLTVITSAFTARGSDVKQNEKILNLSVNQGIVLDKLGHIGDLPAINNRLHEALVESNKQNKEQTKLMQKLVDSLPEKG